VLAGGGGREPILAALGPQEACFAFSRSIPAFLGCLFPGVCARFLISSEENRYGYDYRSRCFDAAQGD
jgi:hypothetical protein